MRECNLELWPGYVSSIRQHERDILMCVEIVTKVMRIETLLDILNNCFAEDRQRYRVSCSSFLLELFRYLLKFLC